MTASGDSPREGESTDGESHWEDLGRKLLIDELELVLDEAHDVLTGLKVSARDREKIDSHSIGAGRGLVEEVRDVVELAAMVSPESTPYPHWTELVDERCVEQYAYRVQELEEEGGGR